MCVEWACRGGSSVSQTNHRMRVLWEVCLWVNNEKSNGNFYALTVLLVATEEHVVALEIGTRIKVVALINQNFLNTFHAINHQAGYPAQSQLYNFAIFPSQVSKRLVRYIVAIENVEIANDKFASRSRRLNATATATIVITFHLIHQATNSRRRTFPQKFLFQLLRIEFIDDENERENEACHCDIKSVRTE